MQLTAFEESILAGEQGEPRRLALSMQLQIGRVFDAADFVEINQVHIMGDTESLGEAGVAFLEKLAGFPVAQRRVMVPTVTDPRGMDFCHYQQLKQEEDWAELERRTITALSALGVLMTDTCINYQTVAPPVFGEHLAFGDTGSTIYANSVLGARSNFEGGPSALAAALTGRTPRYGLHLDENRVGTHLFKVEFEPRTLSDWGALGAVIGQQTGSYWTVPVVDDISCAPTSDQLKHFGAALASYGSVPLFHMIGVTPEATDLNTVLAGASVDTQTITTADVDAFYASFGRHQDKVDVVVFAAPQLSLIELQQLTDLLRGKQIHAETQVLIATSPENKSACDRLGFTEAIEDAGAILLQGVCFYQMYAREMGEANGWRNLLTNSAKLANIIAGYGYKPVLAPMADCVAAAIRGKY